MGCGSSRRQAQPAGLSFSHPPHHESSWFSFLYCSHNIPARGARVFVDSMLPLVFVPSRFLHANRSHRWRRNSLRGRLISGILTIPVFSRIAPHNRRTTLTRDAHAGAAGSRILARERRAPRSRRARAVAADDGRATAGDRGARGVLDSLGAGGARRPGEELGAGAAVRGHGVLLHLSVRLQFVCASVSRSTPPRLHSVSWLQLAPDSAAGPVQAVAQLTTAVGVFGGHSCGAIIAAAAGALPVTSTARSSHRCLHFLSPTRSESATFAFLRPKRRPRAPAATLHTTTSSRTMLAVTSPNWNRNRNRNRNSSPRLDQTKTNLGCPALRHRGAIWVALPSRST